MSSSFAASSCTVRTHLCVPRNILLHNVHIHTCSWFSFSDPFDLDHNLGTPVTFQSRLTQHAAYTVYMYPHVRCMCCSPNFAFILLSVEFFYFLHLTVRRYILQRFENALRYHFSDVLVNRIDSQTRGPKSYMYMVSTHAYRQ